jgi:hypothetical protein
MSTCKQKNRTRSPKDKCVDSLSLQTLVNLKEIARKEGVKYTGVPKAKLVKDIRSRINRPCKTGKKSVNSICVLSEHLNRYSLDDIQVIATDLGIVKINKLSKKVLIRLITKTLNCDKGQFLSGKTKVCTDRANMNENGLQTDPKMESLNNVRAEETARVVERQNEAEFVTKKKADELKLKLKQSVSFVRLKDTVDDFLDDADKDSKTKIDLLREQNNEIEKTTSINIKLLNKAIIENKSVDSEVIKSATKMKNDLVKHGEIEKMLLLQQARYINGTTTLNKSLVKDQYIGIDSGADIEKGLNLKLENEAKQVELRDKLIAQKKQVMNSINEMKLKLEKTSSVTKTSIGNIIGSPVGSNKGLMASIADGVKNLKPVVLSERIVSNDLLASIQTGRIKLKPLNISKEKQCSINKMLWDDALQTCKNECENGKFDRNGKCLANNMMTLAEQITYRRKFIEDDDDDFDEDVDEDFD